MSSLDQMRAESEETEGGKAPPVVEQEDEKAQEEENGGVQEVRVPGAEAGPPGDEDIGAGDGGAERVHERHVRAAGGGGGQAVEVHREANLVIEGDPGGGQAGPPGGARPARHRGRGQGHLQLYVLRSTVRPRWQLEEETQSHLQATV